MKPPHPMQTVRATEELLDQLVVGQPRDVSGAHGDLARPSNRYGFVSGAEGLLSHRLHLLLQRVARIQLTESALAGSVF